MRRLEEKVAIVTGAGRDGNIGVAICEAYLREGARGVIGTDLREEEARAITERLGAIGAPARFRFLRHDVTDPAAWDGIVAATLDEFGAIDVLVNNAGIALRADIRHTSLDDMRRAMAVNSDAIFLGMRACLAELERCRERFEGGGAIINTLSTASYIPNNNNVGYSVSKAAGRMLTLCAAREFGPMRIRVNSVHPGLTMTPMIAEGLERYAENGVWASAAAGEAALKAQGPLGISSTAADAAHAYVYLASEEARFMTGAALWHDGGIGHRL